LDSDSGDIEETLIVSHRDQLVSKEENSHYFSNLVPNVLYTFNISAKFLDGDYGPSSSQPVETPSDGMTCKVKCHHSNAINCLEI
jgi:hypothetical protein